MNKRSVRALAEWFDAHARELPWRTAPGLPRDPYAVLVSEAMLQQTQVSRIVERFPRFIARFPTVQSLAVADERDVLALWSGLGYYRRARNLHAAAKMVVGSFGGVMPRTVKDLLTLPGVGRYTAGAIASLAYGIAAPIVDGNVARVTLRIHGRAARADDRELQPWLWERATELARSAATVRDMGAAVANEAIMELGATVCLPAPATPRCADCPLAPHCVARKEGTHDRIPMPKSAPLRRALYCATVVVTNRAGEILLEQRAARGMWSGMWQALTLEKADTPPTALELASYAGLRPASLSPHGAFDHGTTHRAVRFEVYTAAWTSSRPPPHGSWVRPDALDTLGMSNAHRRAIELARSTVAVTIPTRSRSRPPAPLSGRGRPSTCRRCGA